MIKTKKVMSWLSMIVLGLVLAGLAFIYFAPGYDLYLVRSESMEPAINMGDLIITGPLNGPINGEVKPGTVVTYEYQKELVTHRVQSIEGTALVTQGDAVEDPDPWSVTMSSVKGIYLFKVPYVGYVTSFVQTKLGWFLAIIVPAALLILWLAKDIVKEALSSDEKTNENKGEVMCLAQHNNEHIEENQS
jgi:signal peptidase